MITNKNIVSISQMRKETESVLDKVDKLDMPLYLFSRSKIKAVLVNPEKYAEMQEIIDDYFDQKELLSVTDEELKSARDWSEVREEIKAEIRNESKNSLKS